MPARASRICAVLMYCWLLALPAVCHAETVLITGANSGLGFQFASQYAARGWKVIATHRRASVPDNLAALAAKFENVQVERLDVTRPSEIHALAAKLKDVPIDVLINNAGVKILGPMDDPRSFEAQQFGTLDYAQFDIFMHTNALGPIAIAQAFLGNVKASPHGKIISISSSSASISPPLTASHTGYWYAASKVALNLFMKYLAQDIRQDGIVVVLFQPGEVRTGILEYLKIPGLMDPAESVASMIRIIDTLTMADTGKFLTHNGSPQPF